MKSVAVLTGALLVMLALGPPSGLAQSDTDVQTRVDDLVGKHYLHGIPYDVAHALGPGALPRLFELLGNVERKPFWVNIVVTIGFIEDDSAVDPLLAFLQNTQGEVDRFTFRALLSVPYALGCIASGDDRALQYLVGNLDASREPTVPWRFRDKPVSELIVEQSVMSLAVSGRPEARSLLLDLQAKDAQRTGPQARALRGGNVGQGLAIMDRIATEGRAAVLNPRRGNWKGSQK